MKVNNKEYEIIKLLGKGKGGYSYLATDGEKQYVLKQIHHEPCDYYQFGNKIEAEINDYKRLISIGINMPEMFDVDIENERILKEYIDGDTIFDKVLKDEMRPQYFDQIKSMCQVLYANNTNIDYFPTNFVVQDEELYYIDYECNDYMDEWNYENWGVKYWSKTEEFIKYVEEKMKTKKIAIIADIHSNYIAFNKCVEYSLGRGIDTFLFLGDYVAELPYPQRTMERLYEMKEKYNCLFIRGNKEDYWLEHQANGNSKVIWKDKDSTTGMLLYAYNQLNEKDLKFYEEMSIAAKIEFEGYPAFTVCHGTPDKTNEKMIPDTDRIRQIMDEMDTDLIVCGHTHIQNKYEYNGKTCLNTGALGVPLYSDGKLQFIIMESDGGPWKEELVSLKYDVESVIKDIEEAKLEERAPSWTRVTKQLLRDGKVCHSKVLFRAMDLCEQELGECIWPEVPEKYWKMAADEMIGKD